MTHARGLRICANCPLQALTTSQTGAKLKFYTYQSHLCTSLRQLLKFSTLKGPHMWNNTSKMKWALWCPHSFSGSFSIRFQSWRTRTTILEVPEKVGILSGTLNPNLLELAAKDNALNFILNFTHSLLHIQSSFIIELFRVSLLLNKLGIFFHS